MNMDKNKTCHDCSHWSMDKVGKPEGAIAWQANFGRCMAPLPALPFWAEVVVKRNRYTDATAGEGCPTFVPCPDLQNGQV